MVRASASQSVDLWFNPLVESYQNVFKMVFTVFLLGIHGRLCRTSRQVFLLGKALNGTAPLLCGRQVAQFSLGREGCWQGGHPTVKQMPCYKNADHYLLWRPLVEIKPKVKEEDTRVRLRNKAKPEVCCCQQFVQKRLKLKNCQ